MYIWSCQTSYSHCFRSLQFISSMSVWGDEEKTFWRKCIISISRQTKYGTLKIRHLPTFYTRLIQKLPHGLHILGIISSRRWSLLCEKKTFPSTMSLMSLRSFTARCYTQFKLLSDQGANIYHRELALVDFTPGGL